MLDKLEILKSNGIGINFLQQQDYSNIEPIQKVRKVLERCHGGTIVGFKQVYILNGLAEKGSRS
jgi:hypothetical protein